MDYIYTINLLTIQFQFLNSFEFEAPISILTYHGSTLYLVYKIIINPYYFSASTLFHILIRLGLFICNK